MKLCEELNIRKRTDICDIRRDVLPGIPKQFEELVFASLYAISGFNKVEITIAK